MVTNQGYQQYYPSYPNFTGYPQQMQPQMQQSVMQQTQSQNQIIFAWIPSEEDAIKFPVNAGQGAFLLNQNEDYLYMKSIDQLGKMTFVKKRLVDEGNNQTPKIDLSGYIRKEEIEDLIDEKIQKEVDRRVSEMSFKATKTRKKLDSTPFELED